MCIQATFEASQNRRASLPRISLNGVGTDRNKQLWENDTARLDLFENT